MDSNHNTKEYVSEYIPIFIQEDEKAIIYYGRNSPEDNSSNLVCNDEFLNSTQDNGCPFTILVANTKTHDNTIYRFNDNMITLFD